MKKLLREIRSNALLRYVMVFSLIVILIILVMGTYLYRFYYRTIYGDFTASNEDISGWCCKPP